LTFTHGPPNDRAESRNDVQHTKEKQSLILENVEKRGDVRKNQGKPTQEQQQQKERKWKSERSVNWKALDDFL